MPAAAEAADVVPIAQVQGTGAATTLPSTPAVTVEGIVTADHRTGGYRGIYVQTEGSGGAADATPGASDGIFIFFGNRNPVPSVAIGDKVQVTGRPGEFNGLTQLSANQTGDTVTVLSSGNALPEPVALADTVVGDAREQFEGMLVRPTGDYYVASFHEADRYGSLWLAAGDMPVKSTEAARPGPDADAIAAANAAARIVLDDGKNNQTTSTLKQPYLPAGDPVRTGDKVEFGDLAYVLHYGFDLWRLQPQTPLDSTTPDALEPTFADTNPRPAAPDAVGGDLQVASFNVLNYFTTLTTQDSRARGARSPEQFAAQKGKIVAAITAMGAEVVALQEMENSTHFGPGTPDVAVADLVAGLNAAAGTDVWAYVPTPAALLDPAVQPGTDVIMNAIIYRTDAVTPVGASQALVDPAFDDAREPIAQAFAPVGDGAPFAVVANHFKSKTPPDGEDGEPADGQGWFNEVRVAQAQALAAFVGDLGEAGTTDVVVLGDLNSYSQEDPVVTLTGAGLVDLVAAKAPGQYSYTFDGELGSLDHALGTGTFAARVTGADVWDINADEWSGLQYYGAAPELGTVYRASDHDPTIVGITATLPPVTIDLLGINDFHGRLEASGAVAGAAVLAGAVDSYRAANPNTLFVSAGDNIGATTFTSFIQDDEPTIAALNAAGLDTSALGNHEFDRGRADLDERVLGLADFPYLAANVYDRATGEPAYDPYWVTDVDGIQVGFIGAVTEALPTLVTPAGIATLETRSIVTEVNRFAGRLSDGDATNGEADVIVVLVHEGAAHNESLEADPAFNAMLGTISGDVDAIFTGHTHLKYAFLQPVEGWADGLARPVVQSGQYGENLAHVQLQVDRESGDVVANSAEIVPLANNGFTPDPEVAAIVADAVAVAKQLGSVKLGDITDDLMRARASNGTAENRGGESTLGNLIADVQLWATSELGTQIAFMNPGGMRTDITYASTGAGDPDGNVTYQEAANVQPFANTLVTMTLTGEQIVQVLEEQWQPAGAQRPFLKLGTAGLTYTYDPAAAAGSRITQVWVGETPLDPTATYQVVVNSFLASGGDNFATLALGADKADSGRVDLQAFVDYLGQFSPISPDLAQRAVGVHVATAAPEGGFLPGDSVTVDLSSLLFSAGEPQGDAPTAVLTIGGTQVATAAIDPAVVDTTDEVGRATATIVIPEGAEAGDLEVVVTVPSTGTTTSFTVPVAEVAGPACVVSYDAVRVWPNLLLGGVRVTNTGTDAVGPWSLTWSYTKGEKAGVGIGASISQRGADVTAKGTWLNRTLDPGESTTFAFIGKAPRGTVAPTAFQLNGVDCTVE
ncbi:ExeM/NucH family extracellular endonuclease [Actinotalea fermentans]|uniref:Multifunctional nuclease/2',3'-cyclic-nucleotide 2'-phosphodiesterase/5'-nucleotidase/3'-nucleotidase n=1 Tax=Actinotalea fermentans TaxID=43671 RepID=A0A511YYP6_9CELL|nr:ExeM/NucH family extracellular endonuclease [Actinotalea fermentans]KGM16180.1 hypothetical protein N867_02545 [Actinotalea fermentans ATCC 43279 = JCM 9966 = DSM 3133]GEN80323.1 multifunctional nuclease/2',3'-cyclic-nucleotide 2'-phosphodiesterase/5'-nucleotidase/3'-nucleotidase [Actinotalea fermentans]